MWIVPDGAVEEGHLTLHISQYGIKPLLEYVQDTQLHSDVGPVSRSFRGFMEEKKLGLLGNFPPAEDLLLPPRWGLRLGLGCGVRSRFTWGEKSSSGMVSVSLISSLSSELVPLPVVSEGDVSSSPVLFLFFSLLPPGEKKERMSCCFSFSNWGGKKAERTGFFN